jgi:hypothetical protein
MVVIDSNLVSAVLAIAAIILGGLWLRGKSCLKAIRTFVDDLDNAMTDNAITEDEWNLMWADFKNVAGSCANRVITKP